MKAYQLKITIKGSHPPIWRRVIVPAGLSFAQLSVVLNKTMGWCGYHLNAYEFKYFRIEDTSDAMRWDDRSTQNAALTIIDDVFDHEDRFNYIYDFGDYWQHRVIIEAILDDYAMDCPTIVKYKGETPYEDCGGIDEYYQLLAILDDPKHPEYAMYRDWVDTHFTVPFDLQAVNTDLAQLRLTDVLSGPMTENEIYQDIAHGGNFRRINPGMPAAADEAGPEGLMHKFNRLSMDCYTNLAYGANDLSLWDRAYDILLEIVATTRRLLPNYAPELDDLEEGPGYCCDFTGWLEDYLDELQSTRQYQKLRHVCEKMLSLFEWKYSDPSLLHLSMAESYHMEGDFTQALAYCEVWYQADPTNLTAAAALAHALMIIGDLPKVQVLLDKHLPQPVKCNPANVSLVGAAVFYYERIGNIKKAQSLQAALDAFEKQFFAFDEDLSGIWDFDEDDELPF